MSMRTRVHNWLDTKTMTPLYSFQIWDPGDRRWKNVAEGSKPLLFENEKDRDAKRAEYRKKNFTDMNFTPTTVVACAS